MSYAPPAYQDNPTPAPHKSYNATTDASPSAAPAASSSSAPLLAGTAAQAGMLHAGFGSPVDEDDWKYGTSVATSDVTIRMAFIRKVYSILAVQLLATVLVSIGMVQPQAIEWTRSNPWFFWVPLVGSFSSLGVLFWKIDRHPLNLFILGVFTIFEALAVGTVCSFYETRIVLQAAFITLGVFVGLTIFTFQSKWDFDGLAPWLSAGIMVLITTSLVGIFFPFGQTTDLLLACGGCLIFSGYILYDTHAIMKKLSPDESIMGALRLYLDAINLFLQILRVLNNSNNRD